MQLFVCAIAYLVHAKNIFVKEEITLFLQDFDILEDVFEAGLHDHFIDVGPGLGRIHDQVVPCHDLKMLQKSQHKILKIS